MIRADRSGPLRLGAVNPVDPPKPFAEMPAIAVIMAYLVKRSPAFGHQPFPVPEELFTAAEGEMKANMQKRGFPLPVSKDLERDGVRNFMLLGTPIVVETK